MSATPGAAPGCAMPAAHCRGQHCAAPRPQSQAGIDEGGRRPASEGAERVGASTPDLAKRSGFGWIQAMCTQTTASVGDP